MRKRYLESLNRGQLDLDVAFEYAVSKGATPDRNAFNLWCSFNTDAVIYTLNRHFEIIRIETKEGEVLRCM